jgi:ATP-binding cassette subfamily B multidrug efflux pump
VSADLEGYLDVEERDSREVQQHNLKRLFKEILGQPGTFTAGCAMLLVATVAVLIEPRLFGYAIDEAIVPKRWDLLQRVAIFYLLVTCIRAATTIAHTYLFELLGQRVTQNLRCRLFSHLQRLPITIFDKNPAGRLLTRVTNDISSLSEMFTAGFVSMIGNALMVLGIQIWLIALDVKLGLIAGSVLPVLIFFSVHFSKKLRVSYREARSKLSALNAFFAENILGMKVVHLFNRQKLHLERFDRIGQWYADARIASVRVFAYFQPTITWSSAVAVSLIIWFGGKEALSGHIKLGVLVAYFSYILSMFQPLREIADKWNIFLSGMASAERIFGILDWPTEISEKEVTGSAQTGARALALQGHIVFENVWFAYEADHWILKDFSLEIRKGHRVGIVGHTGAGKTTIISLLMRFYEPQKGRILIDGKDIREYTKRDLRAAIGIIQQDVFLYSGSLYENMTFWGSQSVEDQEIKESLKKLGYEHWLEGSKTREKVELLERGGNLSMGERQVLAFTRALTAKPQIWILDEATANMDSGTEIVLQRALEESARGRTSILIAHRLATVRAADQIVVIHKGSLVEQGTHQELVARDGLYARLYRYQLSQEEQRALLASRTAEPAERGGPAQPVG